MIAARPTLSQLQSFKVQRTTSLKYMKSTNLLILRLWNCETAGRELTGEIVSLFYHLEPKKWTKLTRSAFCLHTSIDDKVDETRPNISQFQNLKIRLFVFVVHDPTSPFTIELKNPSHDVPKLHKIRRSTDIKALKLGKGSSGSYY